MNIYVKQDKKNIVQERVTTSWGRTAVDISDRFCAWVSYLFNHTKSAANSSKCI